MGIVTSCCKKNQGDMEERVPLKTNKGGSGGIIMSSFSTKEPSDDFIVDPIIRQFLEDQSDDDDQQNVNYDDFDDLIKQQDD